MFSENRSLSDRFSRSNQKEGQHKRKLPESFQLENFHTACQRFMESSLNDLVKRRKITPKASEPDDFPFFGRKSSLLRRLFLKFLKLRCPLLTPLERKATVFITSILISSTCDKETQDFKPDAFWSFMTSKSVTYSRSSISAACVEFRINHGLRDPINVAYISLFGEFLYSICTLNADIDSPMAEIKRSATEFECQLMDEIATTLTPKLGILSFIVFRNAASCHSGKVHRLFDDQEVFKDIFPGIHESFKMLVKKVRRIPVLNIYFCRFQRFICSNICKSSDLFRDRIELLDVDYLNSLEDGSSVLKYDDRDNTASLVFIMVDVLEIFLALHRKKGDLNLKIFKYVPKYLKRYKLPQNTEVDGATFFTKGQSFYCVESVLLAVSLLLDFFFIETWESDSINDYVSICERIKVALETKSEGVRRVAREAALFPFI